MKITKKKGVDGKLDKAWAELVKLRAGNQCEYCGTTRNIQSHHIYSRSRKSTRWNPINGVSLCAGHHTLSSSFSAHKTPLEFTDWLYNKKGTDFVDRLRMKANATSKLHPFEKEILLTDLLKQIADEKL